MTSRRLTQNPLCHAKMGVLPTPSYRVSQNYLPPTCVTSLMNALLPKVLQICLVELEFERRCIGNDRRR